MQTARVAVVLAALALTAACSSEPPKGAPDMANAPAMMRAMRYCEILVGNLVGSDVQLDVYNTWGLNDCPAAAWGAVDAAQVMTETGAAIVRLNGPRYWMQDAFENSSFLDPTPRTLGGIAMRLSGRVSVPLAEASGQTSYRTRTITRSTVTVFDAGKPVYELVAPDGRVFTMQSFSVQLAADLTPAALDGLAARLTQLPTGWQFRTRTLTETLRVAAMAGTVTVVQDELADTYILSSGN